MAMKRAASSTTPAKEIENRLRWRDSLASNHGTDIMVIVADRFLVKASASDVKDTTAPCQLIEAGRLQDPGRAEVVSPNLVRTE